MSPVADWSRYFALTLLVELAVAVPLLGVRESLARKAGAVAFGQLATHPAVWFVVLGLGFGRMHGLLLAEGWALVAELLLYRLVFPQLKWSRALAVSGLANGASLAAGTLVPW